MRIEILGDNCARCRILYENVRQAVDEAEVEIVRTNDPDTLVRYGLRSFPGLAIDGTLESSGKFLSVEEIRRLIQKRASSQV